MDSANTDMVTNEGIMLELSNEDTELAKRYQDIAFARQCLSNTDWIIVRIGEARIVGVDDLVLVEKQSAELAERESVQKLINSLEQKKSLSVRLSRKPMQKIAPRYTYVQV